MNEPPLQLVLDRRGGELVVELDLPGGLSARDYVAVTDERLEDLVEQAWRLRLPSGDTEAIALLGELLANEMLPPGVVEHIASQNSEDLILRLSAELMDVPWEWVQVGGRRLDEIVHVQRQLIVRSADVREQVAPIDVE
ncbi:MAG: hypothetical protein ACI9UU_001384, partial [Candidatus Azotimanducaceae bacterium]